MRRFALVAAVVAAVVLATTHSSTQPRADSRLRVEQIDGRQVAAGEVLLKLRGPLPARDLLDVTRVADADTVRTVGRTGLRRLRSRSQDTRSLLRLLSTHPAVAYAEPNYIVHTFADPPDPLAPQLWGLLNVGQAVNSGAPGQPGADIHAAQAWDVSIGSTAHVVAVIDTGIDYTHADLVGNLWSAPAPFTVTVGGVAITCPAGSHGFNAIALTCDPMDDHNHGTHVAGTIGATAGNGIGVVGVNWVTQVMGVKFLNAAGSGTIADAINGLDFVMQTRQAFAATGGADVRVLSNSWGGRSFSQALRDEIAATAEADMLFVAAAGNDGFSNDILPTYPASYDVANIVAVAATTNTDGRAFFSNYGAASVDLGAPGVDILSTTIGNTYSFASGTSMATPHVSGAAALVLSRCTLDTSALKSTLLSTVQPIAALASLTATGGRLDVNSAIRSCMAPPAEPTGLTATGRDGSVALAWSAVAGATGFTVKRSETSGGPYTSIATGVVATTFVDTAVVNDRTYFYVVAAANGLGASDDSNEASATPKAPADLVVSALAVPANAGAATTIDASVTTRNQGAGSSLPSTTRLWLSKNAVVDATDVVLGVQAVPALSPGAVLASVVSLAIPADTVVGLYFIIAKADADGVEAEASEFNNTQGRVVSIGPDLVASSLTAPLSAGPGSVVAVSETVKNQGGGTSAASTTRFYLSANAALDAADVMLTGGRAVPGLAPGATHSGSTVLTIPAATATGTYYLFAKADGDAAVLETQETNNTTLRSIQVGGDLAVTAMTVPLKAGAGTSIVVADTTANQGAGAVATSTTRFYLSVNPQLDASDRLLTGARAVPALGASAVSVGSTTVAIPPDVATGGYFVIAKADADGVVVETQEGNNVTARSVAIGPDLSVSAMTVPFTIMAGATVTVSETVLNQGAGAAGASTTRFYLSTNITLDGSDVVLDGSRGVLPLAAATASGGTTQVTIPAGTTPGIYYFFVKADADGAVTESQEVNNVSWRVIQVSTGS